MMLSEGLLAISEDMRWFKKYSEWLKIANYPVQGHKE
jgi:hypothetical protein